MIPAKVSLPKIDYIHSQTNKIFNKLEQIISKSRIKKQDSVEISELIFDQKKAPLLNASQKKFSSSYTTLSEKYLTSEYEEISDMMFDQKDERLEDYPLMNDYYQHDAYTDPRNYNGNSERATYQTLRSDDLPYLKFHQNKDLFKKQPKGSVSSFFKSLFSKLCCTDQ